VQRHPRGLQRRRAVAGERGAGQEVVAEQRRDDAGHVEAGLPARQAAAQHQVVDLARVELAGTCASAARTAATARSSGRTSLSEPLPAPPDRGAGGGDDDGFGHR
jgi:hypothetical protein